MSSNSMKNSRKASIRRKKEMTVIQEVLYESPLYGICYPNGPRKEGEEAEESISFTRMERIFFLVYYVSIIVAAETAAFFVLDSLDIYNYLVDEIKEAASSLSTQCLPISESTVEVVMQWLFLPLFTNTFYFILFKPVQKCLKRDTECCNPVIYLFIGVTVAASTFFIVAMLKVQNPQKQQKYLLNVVTMIGASLLILHVIIGYIFLKIYRWFEMKCRRCCSCGRTQVEDEGMEEGREVSLYEFQQQNTQDVEAGESYTASENGENNQDKQIVYVVEGQSSTTIMIQELQQKVAELESGWAEEKIRAAELEVVQKEKRSKLRKKLKQTQDELIEAKEEIKFLAAKVERLQKRKERTSRRSEEALDKHKERMDKLRRSKHGGATNGMEE